MQRLPTLCLKKVWKLCKVLKYALPQAIDPINFVIHTVECTPRSGQKGIVKLVIKSECNNTLWTAVQFPEDIFAFYSNDNDLLGYQWKNLIFNDKNKEVMHIEKRIDAFKSRFMRKSAQKVNFVVLDNRNSLIATISEDINCTSIYRPNERHKIAYWNELELVFVIPLAVKINSAIYKLDEWPLPEITYHYKNVKEPGNFVFSNQTEIE